MQDTIRLVMDPPQDGATNMAVDDVLLDGVERGASPPTLRLYRWGPPCLSLGYFQKYDEAMGLNIPLSLKCEVVRRVTGGGAIIHDQELTYSLSLPLGHTLVGCDVGCLYRGMHQWAIEAASLLGVVLRLREEEDRDAGIDEAAQHERTRSQDGEFLCFHRAHGFDLVAGGLKVMGSAQRRVRRAMLQHGSLMLVRRYHQQRCMTLSILASRIITWETAAEALVAAWPVVFPQVPLVQGDWTDDELSARWDHVHRQRSTDWVKKR